jgi:hypothetical protein
VLASLDRVSRDLHQRLATRGAPHGAIELHLSFLELYRLTTQEWILFAAGSRHADLLHELIAAYHDAYRRHVVDHLGLELDLGGPWPAASERRPPPHCVHSVPHGAPHWAPYFRLAERAARRPGPLVRALGLLHAVRAHARHDLCEALVAVYRRRRERGEPVPDLAALSEELLGPAARRLLRAVARVRVAMVARRNGWSVPRRGVVALGCRLAEPLWLACLQRWRCGACREAARRLAAGGAQTSSSRSARGHCCRARADGAAPAAEPVPTPDAVPAS